MLPAYRDDIGVLHVPLKDRAARHRGPWVGQVGNEGLPPPTDRAPHPRWSLVLGRGGAARNAAHGG